ncbi:MAG: iron ABC transporter substrate-binding protein, partial [Spirochaetia bacterium]|nr:iron ABC transporter substrate-binding protein [Spirochaetia bacterium]
MNFSRILFLLAPFVLIAAPLLLRPKPETPARLRIVIITPHGEQIRYEYGRAFAAWAKREKGILVDIDWRAP